MVGTLKKELVEDATTDKPLLVELVGLAGAGKTTLTRALTRYSERFVEGKDISLRRIESFRPFVCSAPTLLPFLLHWSRFGRYFTWDEVKAVVYLKGWPPVFKSQMVSKNTIILLNQGPIFRLATLHAFGPDRLRDGAALTWWNDMFTQWSVMLDVIIWLDAPDTVLEQRINARSTPHLVKGRPEQEVREFLTRYRNSYQHVLRRMAAYGRQEPFQIDTSRAPVKEVVEKVLSACNVRPEGD